MKNGRAAYWALHDHYLGPSNVDNMASTAEKALLTAQYDGERRNWNFESYVSLHQQQHVILEGLTFHGYMGFDDENKSETPC